MQIRLGIACCLLIASSAAVVGADDPTGSAWKFDVVRLKNGSVLKGLILDQTPAGFGRQGFFAPLTALRRVDAQPDAFDFRP